MKKILVLDDDELFLKSFARLLSTIDTFSLESASDSTAFVKLLAFDDYDLVFIDLNMPKPNGAECLQMCQKMMPHLPVIIISGEKDADVAIDCIKSGAYDYITKPIDINRLKAALMNVFKVSSLQKEVVSITRHLLNDDESDFPDFDGIITQDHNMLKNFRYIEAISKSDNPIIICGETGTGKELVAEAVHRSSKRSGRFVAVDVSGLDDNVFSDTLFGHIRGAFTGADKTRAGLIEAASGGTLFLDEIGDLQEASQIKLLRLLQTGMYYTLGLDTPKKSNARIVAAVNKPVEELMFASFREDLYYRLSTHRIDVPPLRERKGDIRLLTEHFYKKAVEKYEVENDLTEEVIEKLTSYNFPGNVRELIAVIEDSVIQQKLGINLNDIITNKLNIQSPSNKGGALKDIFGHFPTLSEATDKLILDALEEAKGSQREAAGLLGISRQAFNRRLNIIKKS